MGRWIHLSVVRSKRCEVNGPPVVTSLRMSTPAAATTVSFAILNGIYHIMYASLMTVHRI
jgi:hypothetical protein